MHSFFELIPNLPQKFTTMTPAFAFSLDEAQQLARMRQFEFSRSPLPPSVHRVKVRVSYELKAYGQTAEHALSMLQRSGMVWGAPELREQLRHHGSSLLEISAQKLGQLQQFTFLFEWVFERHICAPNPKEAQEMASHIETLPQHALEAVIDTEWLGYL